MVTAAEFIRAELTRLHQNLDRSIADLTAEQLHAVPAGHPKANTIAFGLWHYVRTEDNVVRFVIQDRRAPVWTEGGYAERLGLPPVAQGTGMPAADAQALRISDVALFREYMGQVWASTEALFDLARTEPGLLEKTVTIKPIGDMPAIRALGGVCLTHGVAHFGQIELTRTLIGLAPVVGV